MRAAGAKSAFIYGPFAEGTQKDNTVDNFVIGASQSLGKGLKEIEDDFSLKINAFAVSEEEFNAKKKEDDQAMKDIHKSKRIVLMGRLKQSPVHAVR